MAVLETIVEEKCEEEDTLGKVIKEKEMKAKEGNEETEDKDSDDLTRNIDELLDGMMWSVLQEDDRGLNSEGSSNHDDEEVSEAVQKKKEPTIFDIEE